MRTSELMIWMALPAAAIGCTGRVEGTAGAERESLQPSIAPATPEARAMMDRGELGGAARPADVAEPPTTAGAAYADGRMIRREAEKAAKQSGFLSKIDDDEAPGAGGSGMRKIKVAGALVPEGPTRAWFPETFLFDPLVVTDDTGAATVKVRVPDRLTTWRVLALGHTRSGAQGGAVTSFLGTLPVYVDPVVPPFLVAGDEIRLPIQMINTTGEPVTAAFAAAAEGAELAAAEGARTVPAQGSLVEYATLRARRPGSLQLQVGFGTTDAVLRTIEVLPAGRPVTTTRSGTLAAPRTLSIDGPAGADPATDRARLMVYPGALALLRSELAASPARGGLHEDAYALLLAGRATELLASLGDQADPAAVRDLSIVAAQRAVRHGRTLDVERATALIAPAVAHPGNPVLHRLGERAAAYLHGAQRPDGTFAGGTGWTLQRVLVATAEATRAVGASAATPVARQRAQAVAVRAAGAFERNLDAVPDGYTAAAMLATGALRGPAADKLRKRVRDAVAGDAGGTWLAVGEGVVRADGTVPGRAEATALAILALDGDPQAAPLLADLGATLLGSYAPSAGWSDGHANLACMFAVLRMFKAPLPQQVTITLTLDQRPVATGTFDRAKLRDVLVLEGLVGSGVAGTHAWGITAEPAVPGLGYSLALQSYVPWERSAVTAGLELAVPTAVTATVGKPVDLALTAIAPSGIALQVTHALPAGVQPDRPSLDALVAAGTISRFELADGRVDLFVPALQPGQLLAVKYRAIPTLAGTLHGAASKLAAGPHAAYVPPAVWTVK